LIPSRVQGGGPMLQTGDTFSVQVAFMGLIEDINIRRQGLETTAALLRQERVRLDRDTLQATAHLERRKRNLEEDIIDRAVRKTQVDNDQYELALKRFNISRECGLSVRRSQEEQSRLELRRAELQRVQASVEAAAAQEQQLRRGIADLEEQGRGMRDGISTLTAQRDALQGQVTALTAQRDDVQREVTDLSAQNARIQALERERGQLVEERRNFEQERGQLAGERRNFEQERGQLAEGRAALDRDRRNYDQDVGRLRAKVRTSRADFEAFQEMQRNHAIEVARLRLVREEQEARQRALDAMQRDLEDRERRLRRLGGPPSSTSQASTDFWRSFNTPGLVSGSVTPSHRFSGFMESPRIEAGHGGGGSFFSGARTPSVAGSVVSDHRSTADPPDSSRPVTPQTPGGVSPARGGS